MLLHLGPFITFRPSTSVDEVRENHDAAVHGYNFFVTNSFLVC